MEKTILNQIVEHVTCQLFVYKKLSLLFYRSKGKCFNFEGRNFLSWKSFLLSNKTCQQKYCTFCVGRLEFNEVNEL